MNTEKNADTETKKTIEDEVGFLPTFEIAPMCSQSDGAKFGPVTQE